MAIASSDIAQLAHLARIALPDDQVEQVTRRIAEVLDLVGQLQAVDTTGVEPMAHPLDAMQRLRSDQITETNQREAFQAIAPATEDGLYLVPRVIE